MRPAAQQFLFDSTIDSVADSTSTTFINNLALPVHRWFRYSAGFSAEWVQTVIRETCKKNDSMIFDPFAGSGTTLLAAEACNVEAWGIDSHPFVSRVAKAKLQWRSDIDAFLEQANAIQKKARSLSGSFEKYPALIRKCFDDDALIHLDKLRKSWIFHADDSPASELTWLVLVTILRKCSRAGTAQWQYVLPKKQKKCPMSPIPAFSNTVQMFASDMQALQALRSRPARFVTSDARTATEIPADSFDLVITSPPYPNNYDYADATRLEMSFLGEIGGWSELHDTVRRHLICSCSQHVPPKSVGLDEVLGNKAVAPIRRELTDVCQELAQIRETKGGKKTYHLMVASYFRDLSLVWRSLRRVCKSGSRICFVVGDSAPYGVYVPVIPWLGAIAESAGFRRWSFEKTRDRNLKWKNRKHRVPLQEGRLWVDG